MFQLWDDWLFILFQYGYLWGDLLILQDSFVLGHVSSEKKDTDHPDL